MQFSRREVSVLILLVGALLVGGTINYLRSYRGNPVAGLRLASPDSGNSEAEGKAVPAAGSDQTAPEASERDLIVVHVAGAVINPGLYNLLPGTRVGEAVATAGGAVADADLDMVNLAAPVSDGQQVYIPFRPAGQLAGGATTQVQAVRPDQGFAAGSHLNLNTATQSQLEGLPGIGPVLAQRIIDYRRTNGPFTTPEDLLKVSGIGDKRLADLQGLVTTQ